jgi:hypothetical protein
MTELARRLGRWWPAAFGAVVVLVWFGPLALPDRVLVARDMTFLHLPLRTDFARLLEHGLPSWDPWLHGGQPLLSNPHYAAWYPTTWLLAVLRPHVALQWAVLLHAALAFAGAWRLARHWGAGRPAAAFAAVAYAGGGFFAGLPSLFLIFIGMSWWPWAMLYGDRALRTRPEATRRERTAGLLGLAAVLEIQILNGDPAAVLASGLGLFALAADAARSGGRPWRRLAIAIGLALALGSVQAVPSAFRLRDSPRGVGLDERAAAVWSTRPLRLVEAVFPRLFGDPARDEEDLYFGWALHDHAYPLLLSIYPGLLVTLLGLSGLLRGGIPRRVALTGGVGAGVLLGIGRHEPLWPLLHRFVPFLAQLRYPEKFLLLAAACMVFAAALELEHLLQARRGLVADRRAFFVPITLACVCATSAAIVAAFYVAAPGGAANFVRSHSGLPPSAAMLAKGVGFLRREALEAVALSFLAVLALVVLRSRVAVRLGALLIVALLAADLVLHDRRLNPVMPLAAFVRAAPLADGLPPGTRVFYEGDVAPTSEMGLRLGPPGEQQLRARLGRLEPLSATLWGHPEVLERDYDLMLTGWGRWALELLGAAWADPVQAGRILDAWSVGARVRPRPPQEMLAALRSGDPAPAPATIALNPAALPPLRSIGAATFHADLPTALAAARDSGFAAGARENLVGEPSGERRFALAEVERIADQGDRLLLDVRSPASSPQAVLVVAAMTFDDGWSAATAAGSLPTWPTALGQLAIVVPAGMQRVELRYRDPWVRVGGLLSLLAGLGSGLSLLRSRSR